MRLFKGKSTYNQHVSVSDIDESCTIITAHECNQEDDNQINANSNIGRSNCNASETDIEAKKSKGKITKNDDNYREKKEVVGGVDKNGE